MTTGTSVGAVGAERAASPSHLRALDGYRAVAAVMVLITHAAFATGAIVASTWGHLLGRLDFGVTLFFLLSGFLLYRPWARASLEAGPRPALRRYVRRRAGRILPLYWLVVAVVLTTLPGAAPPTFATWWQHVLALQIYVPAGTVDGLTQTWSLCTEIAFYVALPVLGAAALGRSRSPAQAWVRQWVVLGACAALALAFVAVFAFTTVLPAQAGYWLPFYLDWFAAGMGLAVIEAALRLPHPPAFARAAQRLARDEVSLLVMAAALFLVVITPLGGGYAFNQWTGPWEMLARHALYGVVGVLLLAPCVLGGGGQLTDLLSRPTPRRIGLISYGVFLWHVYLLQVLMDALGIPLFSGRFWLVSSLLLLTTLAVAAATYRLVERPAQRWAHRDGPSRR